MIIRGDLRETRWNDKNGGGGGGGGVRVKSSCKYQVSIVTIIMDSEALTGQA